MFANRIKDNIMKFVKNFWKVVLTVFTILVIIGIIGVVIGVVVYMA